MRGNQATYERAYTRPSAKQNVALSGGSASHYLTPQHATASGREGSVSARQRFERLAHQWREETALSSFIVDIVLNKNYQSIIGLGWPAVPFILNELKDGPDHWYWALAAITGADPAANAPDGDIEAICDAWLEWGRHKKLVD